ncbi:MAG: hypothetical protein HYW05_02125 [Candidatus Diapherotrites archaeon]|nr:hypothetical protein [Candidatus Diapherotrites archaeon]
MAGRYNRINLARLKKFLKLTGGNINKAAGLHGKITTEAARLAVLNNKALKEFRKKGGQGSVMRVADPNLKKLAGKNSAFERDLAWQETIQKVLAAKNVKEAAEHLNINKAGLYSRLNLIGGVKTFLRDEKQARPKTTTRIFDAKLIKFAREYPGLTRQFAILDTVWKNKITGNAERTAKAMKLKEITVFKRLQNANGAMAALRARLPNKTLRELKLR